MASKKRCATQLKSGGWPRYWQGSTAWAGFSNYEAQCKHGCWGEYMDDRVSQTPHIGFGDQAGSGGQVLHR